MAYFPDKPWDIQIREDFYPSAGMEFYCIRKDGGKEWIDPVCTYKEENGIISVSNSVHTYIYFTQDLESWELRRK